ncbi:MAG: sulfur reduction protein DsrE [Acidimicrobiia bacterium]
MGKYLLVETRDPFDSADVTDAYDLARGLAEEANEVTVYLVQNGVLPLRKNSAAAGRIAELAAKSTIVADEFSLRERGITPDEIVEGVRAVPIDTLVDLVATDGCKVIWH